MKLELKHLAPYLPHGLKIQTYDDDGRDKQLSSLTQSSLNIEGRYTTYGMYADIEDAKPILRPLSDLTKEVEHNGARFIPIIELAKEFHMPSKYVVTHYGDIFDYGYTGVGCKCFVENSSSRYSDFSIYGEDLITHNDFGIVQKLFEWHFDVFGLIPSGLAIDINQTNPDQGH